MGVVSNLLVGGLRAANNPMDERFWAPFAGRNTSAGVRVTPDSALKNSAVWACVRIIAQGVAMLPVTHFKRVDGGGRVRDDDTPLATVLKRRANPYLSAYKFKELMQTHVLLRGNAYALILRDFQMRVNGLVPIHPDAVEPEVMKDRSIRYIIRGDDGKQEVLLFDEVFHLMGPTQDGVKGLGVVECAREGIGLTEATEAYGARFFGNDSRPGGALKVEGSLSSPAAKRLKEEWEAAYSGVNQHRVAILLSGATYQAIGISPEDSQFLGTRQFQVEEIARWFGVPLHLVQETSKSTSWGSGISQMTTGFDMYTLQPHLVNWESAIDSKLVADPEVNYVKFLLDALKRADITTRFAAYGVAIDKDFMMPSEARAREDWDPIPGLDDAFTKRRDAAAAPPPAPPPAGGSSGEEGEDDDEDDAPPPRRGGARSEAVRAALESDHYRLLLLESAGRVVRREQAALAKLAERCGADHDALIKGVAEFYVAHQSYVAQALRMTSAGACLYCGGQQNAFGTPHALGFEDSVKLLCDLAGRAADV